MVVPLSGKLDAIGGRHETALHDLAVAAHDERVDCQGRSWRIE
jgi:hypothetical protein